MKRLLFLFLPFTLLFGQSKIDSINKEIAGKPDTSQYRYLSDICWKYRYNNPKLAVDAGNKAIALAQKLSSKSFEAKILNRIGVIYLWGNKLDLSMEYFRKALTAAQEAKDSIELGYAENNFGGAYQSKRYNTLALEHILTAVQIFEKLNFKSGIAHCSVNLGAIYQHQQNYKKALEYYERVLKFRLEEGNKNDILLAHNTIANTYVESKDYDSAVVKLKEVEKLAEELNDKTVLATALNGLSKISLRKGELTDAYNKQFKSLSLFSEVGYQKGIIEGNLNIAHILIHLRKFAEAEKYLKSAFKILNSNKDKKQFAFYYLIASTLNEAKGNFKEALRYSKLYTTVKDSVTRAENLARGDELLDVRKYLAAKNQNSLLQKTIEYKENQKEYLIIISVLSVFTFVVIYGRYRSKKIANKKLSELNSMKDLLFGIIAHDLKNPFFSILGITDMLKKNLDDLSKEEIKESVALIEKSGKQTYRLLENLLYWSLCQTGNIQYLPENINLTEVIDDVITLFSSAARSKNISLNSKADECIAALCDKEMVKLVLRNLLSNGIKYTTEGGKIDIVLKKKGKFIEVSVEDNGIGITAERKDELLGLVKNFSTPGTKGEKGTGLGLILCKEFIKRNKGDLWIESEEGKGSRFIFSLPAVN